MDTPVDVSESSDMIELLLGLAQMLVLAQMQGWRRCRPGSDAGLAQMHLQQHPY